MVFNWYNRPAKEACDPLANVLRETFGGQVYDIGTGIYAVFLAEPREIWCTTTAIRNHLSVLASLKIMPNDGCIHEWTRDGYRIISEFYYGASPDKIVRHEICV